jgi:hypothetical protein
MLLADPVEQVGLTWGRKQVQFPKRCVLVHDIRWCTKSTKLIILSAIHYHQNPLNLGFFWPDKWLLVSQDGLCLKELRKLLLWMRNNFYSRPIVPREFKLRRMRREGKRVIKSYGKNEKWLRNFGREISEEEIVGLHKFLQRKRTSGRPRSTWGHNIKMYIW